MALLETLRRFGGKDAAELRLSVSLGSRQIAVISRHRAARKNFGKINFMCTLAIMVAKVAVPAPHLACWPLRLITVASADGLNHLVGHSFRIAGLLFNGLELATPCHWPSEVTSQERFVEVFENRDGLRADACNDGVRRIGELLTADARPIGINAPAVPACPLHSTRPPRAHAPCPACCRHRHPPPGNWFSC